MHSLWRGAISFGLIHIPVQLYPASKSRELKFRMLHKKDLSSIHYSRICDLEGKEVPWEEIVKGYETKEGKYVVLTDKDFEAASPKKSKTIEILSFVKEEEIDTVYYETPYYLEPGKGAAKAYVLLREALLRSGKVAVGHFVFHHHEHLGIIRPYGQALILNKLRYQSELLSSKNLNIPQKETTSKKELAVALQLVDRLTQKFKPQDYFDTYTEEIKGLIKKRAKGKEVQIREAKEPKSPKVHDIMSLLQQSLKEPAKKRRRKSA